MTFIRVRLTAAALALSIAGQACAAASAQAEEFSFTATNTTTSTVTKILVSEDKKEWGYFDVGKGIKPGVTENLTWDQSTNSESCEQWVKAAYADGSESEPAKFDFCEEGLEIEF